MNPSLRVYDSVLGLLSNVDNPTPLVRLNRVVPFEHTEVYAKLEWYNPFGAVKDRVASNMVRDAEESGTVGADQKLVEPTSGNTGLALAMIANAKGYSLTTPLSNQIPVEKRTLLRFAGVDVVELEDDLCPAPWAPEGAIAKAGEIASQPGFKMLNQYGNRANPDAHYRTTGPEIWRQTEGRVTHFVAGLGTCGTITGTGRFLKDQDSDIQVIGVHPEPGHDIPGVRSLAQLRQAEFFAPDEYDDLVEIENKEAFELCLRLNQEESITAGPSSGLALAGALRSIPDEPGTIVVIIFADSIFKYASSVTKNVGGMGAPHTASGPTRRERLLDEMIENARANEHLTIEVGEANELWKREQVMVIDVREPEAHQRRHVLGAVNVPLHDLPDAVQLLPEDMDAPILSICERGNLSLSGVLFLQSLGYRNARSVNGGTRKWADEGFATASAASRPAIASEAAAV
jgi:cysteine synthase/rhodanese-related sulfurtransferase